MDESGFGEHQENVPCLTADCTVWWRRDDDGWLLIRGGSRAPLVPLKGNLNAPADQDILEYCVLPALWEQFGMSPFLFHHDCVPVHLGEFGVGTLTGPTEP